MDVTSQMTTPLEGEHLDCEAKLSLRGFRSTATQGQTK